MALLAFNCGSFRDLRGASSESLAFRRTLHERTHMHTPKGVVLCVRSVRTVHSMHIAHTVRSVQDVRVNEVDIAEVERPSL
jgi:hypothetical protein